MDRIVYLDRSILPTTVRRPACKHEWIEYRTSSPEEVKARLQGATIAITHRMFVKGGDLSPRRSKKTSDFLAAEMSARLTSEPAVFRILVQLAEPADNVTDSTSIWPETRTEAEFGILTITKRVDELAPERRKMIFDPLPRVDGIDSAGDPITALRSDIYLVSGQRRRAAAASD